MKKLIVTLLYILIAYDVQGQDKSARISNNLTFQTGLTSLSLKDQTLSRIVFKGSAPDMSLGFNKTEEIRPCGEWSLVLPLEI